MDDEIKLAVESAIEDHIKRLGPHYEKHDLAYKGYHDKIDPFIVDITGIDFADLFSLLNLLLLVDLCQSSIGVCSVRFPGISTGEVLPIPTEMYPDVRRDQRALGELSALAELSREAEPIYRFLAFLDHFGLFDSLLDVGAGGRSVVDGLTGKLRGVLMYYSGAGTKGSRVLPLMPIRDGGDLLQFGTSKIIREWSEALPPDVQSAPLFADGEFARVFGYHLVENILQHSARSAAADDQRAPTMMGAAAMRVLYPETIAKLQNSYPERMRHALHASPLGMLEICVGDHGVGLANTIRDALGNERRRVGLPAAVTVDECVAFAFHPLGSRKPREERLGGAHALNRILNSVAKYGGALRLRTGGRELFYGGADLQRRLVAWEGPLGVAPDSARDSIHPLGTQMQVLLPITAERGGRRAPREGEAESKPSGRPIQIVVTGVYLREASRPDAPISDRDKRQLSSLGNLLAEEPQQAVIAYDFSRRDWGEKDFNGLLATQERILHAKCCIGINLDAGAATTLRQRELQDPWTAQDVADRHFLSELASYHRVFPVMDLVGHIWWFGLAHYPFDALLTRLLDSTKPLTVDDLLDGGNGAPATDAQALLSYLAANAMLFENMGDPAPGEAPSVNGGATSAGWRSRISRGDFHEARSRVVAQRFPQLLREAGAIRQDGKLYRLISADEFTGTFFQLTPLLQDEQVADQIVDWLIGAVNELVPPNVQAVSLVGVTGPVELLGRRLASRIAGVGAEGVSLGHYWRIDDEQLLRAGEWPQHAIVLSDVISTGETLKGVLDVLAERHFVTLGVVNLLKLRIESGDERQPDDGDGDSGRALFWEQPPEAGEIPHFHLWETSVARSLPGAVVEASEDESNLVFVEPFSLYEFDYDALSRKRLRESAEVRENIERLTLLEDNDTLRAGHWVYGGHHFRYTISFGRLFEIDRLAGSLAHRLVQVCADWKIDEILLPLHSHIGALLPRLQTALRLLSGKEIPASFCLATKELSARPYYLLPRKVDRDIGARAAQLATARGSGLRYLILDDTIASGRTVDTLMRAMVRSARKAAQKHGLPVSPVEFVGVFAVLDRQGFARRTFTGGVRRMSLFGDARRENRARHELSLDFDFDYWVDLDLPVASRYDCEDCRELVALREARLRLGRDHLVGDELQSRERELRRRSTETPAFRSEHQRPLASSMELLDLRVKTVELALLHYSLFLRQGYPVSKLLVIYAQFLNARTGDDDDNSVLALVEMGRLLIRNWRKIASQHQTASFLAMLSREVERGSLIARRLLPELGRVMAERDYEELDAFVRGAVGRLASFNEENDPDSSRRSNLFFGLAVFVHYLQLFGRSPDGERTRGEEVLGRLRRQADIVFASAEAAGSIGHAMVDVFRTASVPSTFLSRLLLVLDHTVRARRHGHLDLLPLQLERVGRGVEPGVVGRHHLVEQIREFAHSLRAVAEQFPTVFSSRSSTTSRSALELLAYHILFLERISKAIEGGASVAAEEFRQLARTVSSQFPTQKVSPLFRALRSMVIDLKAVLRHVKKSVEERAPGRWPTEVFGSPADVQVLAVSEQDVIDLLENYLVDPKPDLAFAPEPRLCVSVEVTWSRLNLRCCRVLVYSNLASPEELERSMETGPGLTAFGRFDRRLFGVSAQFRGRAVMPPAPDGFEYSGAVELELQLAFPTTGEVRDV